MASTSFASAVSASLRTLVGASQAKSANDVSSVLRNAADSVVKAQFKIGGVSLARGLERKRREGEGERDARERRERFQLERDLPLERCLPGFRRRRRRRRQTLAFSLSFFPCSFLSCFLLILLPPSTAAAALCRGSLRPRLQLAFPPSTQIHSLTRPLFLPSFFFFFKPFSFFPQLELAAALAAVLLLLAAAFSLRRKNRPVYLVDFNVFRAPDRMKMSREAFMARSRKAGAFDAKALVFQDKMVMKGGLGDHTYLPDAMHASPPVPSMALAREEAEIVMFTAVKDALAAAGLRPCDVDCVVVNCSLFNPTPSLAAMLVNHFKMRSDVVSYSLSGMGCSAGVISIALARELLQTYKNSTCLVVSTVRGRSFVLNSFSGFFFPLGLPFFFVPPCL